MRQYLFSGLIALGATVSAGAALADPGFTTGNVNMRAGPSTAYPRVTVLPRGLEVEIHGCLQGYSWCDVSAGYERGWVSSRYLDVFYNERRVYVPSRRRYDGPVITFGTGYWDRYYRDRSWYRDRDRWSRYNWRDDRWDDRRDRRERREDRRDRYDRDDYTRQFEDEQLQLQRQRERERSQYERQREIEQSDRERQRERLQAERERLREREQAQRERDQVREEARRGWDRERDGDETREVLRRQQQLGEEGSNRGLVMCPDGKPCPGSRLLNNGRRDD